MRFLRRGAYWISNVIMRFLREKTFLVFNRVCRGLFGEFKVASIAGEAESFPLRHRRRMLNLASGVVHAAFRTFTGRLTRNSRKRGRIRIALAGEEHGEGESLKLEV